MASLAKAGQAESKLASDDDCSPLTTDPEAQAMDELLLQYPNMIKELLASIGGEKVNTVEHVESRDIFRFEELPAEIRNEIYQLVLVARSPIKVSRHRDEVAWAKAMKIWKKKMRAPIYRPPQDSRPPAVYFLNAEVSTEQWVGSQRRKYLYGQLHTPGILRINRTAFAEARPVVYGQNEFIFENPAPFTHFVKMIGNGYRLLEDVRVKNFNLDIHEGILSPLRDARKLRNLKLLTLESHRTLGSGLPNIAKKILIMIIDTAFGLRGKSACQCPVKEPCTCVSAEEQKRRINVVVFRGFGYPGVDFGDDKGQIPELSETTLAKLREAVLRQWQTRIEEVMKARDVRAAMSPES